MKEKLGVLSLIVPYLALQEWMPSSGGDVLLAIPVIAVVGAVVAAAGIAKSISAQNKAQDRQAQFVTDTQKKIRKTLSGESLTKKAGVILPKFRELESVGAIPAFQSAAATALSRLGLDDTGLGAALSVAAGGAGELQALSQSIQAALGLNIAQANALAATISGASVAGGGSGSPLGSGLTSLGGGLATSGLGALGAPGGGGAAAGGVPAGKGLTGLLAGGF